MRLLAGLLALGLASCGYHVAGNTSSLLPASVKTIAIPAFSNLTTRYKLSDALPRAISREFITRTRYRVIPDAKTADVVLKGSVLSYTFNPTVFDPATGRAGVADLHVAIQVSLTERATGKVLMTRPRLDVTATYVISQDPGQYFDESDWALSRAGEQVAQKIVSQVLESF